MSRQELQQYIKVCKEQLATSTYRDEQDFLKIAITTAEQELGE